MWHKDVQGKQKRVLWFGWAGSFQKSDGKRGHIKLSHPEMFMRIALEYGALRIKRWSS